MHYDIYIDSLFLLNLGMNLCLLELANCILHHTASGKRVLLGSLCGALFSVVPFLLPGKLVMTFTFGLLLDMICMSAIVFKISEWMAYLRVLEVLSALTLIIGAVLLYFVNRISSEWQLPLATVLMVCGLCFLTVRRLVIKEKKTYECKVILQNGQTKVKINALIDTGNSLVEPVSGAPVAVLDKRVFESLFQGNNPRGFRVIPYHSIDKKAGLLPGYLIPNMQVQWMGFCREYRNIYVGVRQEDMWTEVKYRMIINPDMLKERKTG